MSRTGKTIIAIVFFFAVLILLFGIFSYRLVMKSLPKYEKTVLLSMLEQPVKVYYDKFHVPHIYAMNSKDLFRMAGYICAQDRLWQMEFYRRMVRGTLSEIFGPQTLARDKLFRILAFNRTAAKIAVQLPDETREIVEAYTQGINTFLSTHRDRLPIEFSILGIQPEDWKVTDSIGFIRIMAFQLTYTWHSELAISQVAAKFGQRMARELMPAYPKDAPVIVPAQASALEKPLLGILATLQNAQQLANGGQTIAASNSWVISGARSVSGKPLLANDPHLGLALPSIWYEMHLVSDQYDVMGATLPGVPGVVIGQNRAVAWGLTNGMVDDGDFFIQRIDPHDSTRYWDGKKWQKMRLLREKIKVKGAEKPVFMDIRLTQHGPIISDVHPLLQNDTLALSFQWTGFETSDELSAFLKLNRAGNWQDFLQAIRAFKVPAQNFIFADTSGTIGYHLAGAIPVRRPQEAAFLQKGWARRNDESRVISFEKLPQIKNPPEGFIATANNKIVENYPYYLGTGWEPDSRIRRIVELLQAKKRFAVEDFQNMQRDVFSKHAQGLLPLWLKSLEAADLQAPEKKLVKFLSEWNFEESPESSQATLYNAWFVHTLENTFKDQMGDTLYTEFIYWSNFPIRAMESLSRHPNSAWWDDVRTPQQETRDEILVRSFRQAVKWLAAELGDGPGFWDWGRLHRLTLQHVLGQKSPLDRIFNRGPYPLGGSANTISKAEFAYSRPYSVLVGPSLRQIVDLADPWHGRRVIPGGQSGQPFSNFYDDQIPLWLNGKYKIETMDKQEIRRTAAIDQTFLPPRPQSF